MANLNSSSKGPECWAERYRLNNEILEVLRQGSSLMTREEALVIARANLARR
jgi:hypothetical protein